MKVGYVDTSCLVAVALGEPGGAKLARRLADYDALVSSNLLEADFRSALRREEVEPDATMLSGIAWVLPNRPLTHEIDRALALRPLRGADLWHVATALFLADDPSAVDFLTLDTNQREAARALGFPTPVPSGKR